MDKPNSASNPVNTVKAEEALFGTLKSMIASPGEDEQAPKEQEADAEQSEVTEEQAPEGEAETTESEETEPQADQAENDEESEEPTYEVNGEKVALKELQAGYMKDADYRRKTADVAEKRKAVEVKAAEYEGKLAAADEALTLITAAAQRDLQAAQKALDAVDIDADPAEYVKAERALQRKQREFDTAVNEHRRVKSLQAEEQQARFKTYVAEQQAALVEKLPEYKDSGKRRALGEFAMKTYGFTAEQLQYAADHAFALMAHDAMQFRNLKDKGATKPTPKPVKVQGTKATSRGGNELATVRQSAFDRVKGTKGAQQGAAFDDFLKTFL